MHTVNSRHLGERPDIPTFRRLTRSLAVLDAILSPVWRLNPTLDVHDLGSDLAEIGFPESADGSWRI